MFFASRGKVGLGEKKGLLDVALSYVLDQSLLLEMKE